jgi:copper chaperone CopZ
MQNFRINISILIILAFIAGCGKSDNKTTENKSTENKQVSEQTQNSSAGEGEFIEIKLPTMQCGTCKKNIESAVRKVDGVTDINVIVKEKVAKVNYDKMKTDVSKIEGAIVMAGYQANDKPADKDSYDKLEKCCKVGGH